jgi:hypothetical protein
MAVKKPFAERLKLRLFDPRIQHNFFFGCCILSAVET